MSNSNCSKKLATFESGGSALIKHFSLKRATYYLDQFSSFVGEISSFVFIDDYAYMLNFRNPDNFPAILNIYRLNVKSKNNLANVHFVKLLLIVLNYPDLTCQGKSNCRNHSSFLFTHVFTTGL